MSVLIVAAHPDDEVLGCGGTIARLGEEGQDVYIAILGEGVTSRFNHQKDAPPDLIKTLQRTAHQASKILKAKDIFIYNMPDNRFDTVPLLEIIKTIEGLISRLSPKIIYTHHGFDLNIDHQLVHRAVLTATRPMNYASVKEVFAFEVPSSTEWAFQRLGQPFRPNVFVDISKTLETKLHALSLYETEVKYFPHPRSPEAIQATAHRWGSVIGCKAAEAYELIRSIK